MSEKEKLIENLTSQIRSAEIQVENERHNAQQEKQLIREQEADLTAKMQTRNTELVTEIENLKQEIRCHVLNIERLKKDSKQQLLSLKMDSEKRINKIERESLQLKQSQMGLNSHHHSASSSSTSATELLRKKMDHMKSAYEAKITMLESELKTALKSAVPLATSSQANFTAQSDPTPAPSAVFKKRTAVLKPNLYQLDDRLNVELNVIVNIYIKAMFTNRLIA